MGKLLELGSQGSMEPHHMVYIRTLSSYTFGHGVERKKICHCSNNWILSSFIYIFWSELPPGRAAQLCIRFVLKELIQAGSVRVKDHELFQKLNDLYSHIFLMTPLPKNTPANRTKSKARSIFIHKKCDQIFGFIPG